MSRRTRALVPALLVLTVIQTPAASGQAVRAPVVEAPRQVTGDPNPLRLYDIPKQGGTFNNIDTRGAIGLQSTSDAAYLAWSDSRATDANGDAEDAYFTRVRFGGVAGRGSGDLSAPGDDCPAWGWGSLGAAIALATAGLVLVLGVRRSNARSGA